MADARAAHFERVVFLKLDRFTRNVKEGLADFDALEEAGVGLVFVSDAVDTSTPSGRMFRTLLIAFAEFERERINERTTDGKRAITARTVNEAGQSTQWVGGTLPLGYMVEEGTGRILEDPEHAPAVRRIFELRAAGESTTAIARTLQAEGHTPRPRAGALNPFSGDLVGKTLRTAAYMGAGVERYHSTDDPEPVTFEAPALVTVDEWKAAHAPRKGRRQAVRNAGRKLNHYALSERISHEHADGSTSGMYGNTRPGRSTVTDGPVDFRFYRCAAARATDIAPASCDSFGKVQGQKATAVSADVVEARVLLWALDLLEDPAALAEYARHADRMLLAEDGDAEDIEAARQRLAKLDTMRQRYHDGFAADPNASVESLRENLARLDAEADTLAGVISRAEEVEGHRDALRFNIEELAAMTVVDTGEQDPQHDAPMNRAQEWDLLRQSAGATLGKADRYGRTPQLPAHAIEAAEQFVRALSIEVTLYHPGEDGDPRRPRMSVEFSPTFAPMLAALKEARALQGQDALQAEHRYAVSSSGR